MNKRGISAVVATVLIIMVTVAAVTILWSVIIPMISDNLDFTELGAGGVSVVTSEGYTFYDAVNEKMSVQVKRDVGDADMEEIKVILSIDGSSFGYSVAAPDRGNTKVYVFDLSGEGKPDQISVAPIFSIEGKEKEGGVTSTIQVSNSSSVLSPKANLKLVIPGSLIDSDSWEVGMGSVSGYSRIGSDPENEREYGIGPYGDNVLLWKAIPDSSNNADGGWNSALIEIDHTKAYRSTVWIKKTGSSGGSTYLGCHGSSTNRLNGNANNNPYFWHGDLPELDKWYLLVGYIHGSGDASMTSYGGIYDGASGERVISMTDYKNKVGVTTQRQRAYLYYDVTTTDRQYFWNPTFVEVSDFDLPIEI